MVAQVNDGVITLSRVNREIKNIVDAEVQQGKDRAATQKLVEEKKGELIANLINEELLVQKAKEAGMDADIEASLNQRFLEIMKQNNLKRSRNSTNRCGSRTLTHRRSARCGANRPPVTASFSVAAVEGISTRTPGGESFLRGEQGQVLQTGNCILQRALSRIRGPRRAAVREKAKQLVTQLRGGANFDQS